MAPMVSFSVDADHGLLLRSETLNIIPISMDFGRPRSCIKVTVKINAFCKMTPVIGTPSASSNIELIVEIRVLNR